MENAKEKENMVLAAYSGVTKPTLYIIPITENIAIINIIWIFLIFITKTFWTKILWIKINCTNNHNKSKNINKTFIF